MTKEEKLTYIKKLFRQVSPQTLQALMQRAKPGTSYSKVPKRDIYRMLAAPESCIAGDLSEGTAAIRCFGSLEAMAGEAKSVDRNLERRRQERREVQRKGQELASG